MENSLLAIFLYYRVFGQWITSTKARAKSTKVTCSCTLRDKDTIHVHVHVHEVYQSKPHAN